MSSHMNIYPLDFGPNKANNNQYDECPPRMDDARHFTDYRPNCDANNLIRASYGIQNSHEYRRFLTHNANDLMKMNRNYACQKNCCGPCIEPYEQGTMLPEQTLVKCNSRVCSSTLYDPKGLGQGRQYTDNLQMSCGEWNKRFAAKPQSQRMQNVYPEPQPFNVSRCL